MRFAPPCSFDLHIYGSRSQSSSITAPCIAEDTSLE